MLSILLNWQFNICFPYLTNESLDVFIRTLACGLYFNLGIIFWIVLDV